MEKLRVAIIGTGGISHAHIRAWKKMPDCQVIACCDLDGDKARRFAQDYDIPSVYTHCAELMAREKPDCVSVCTWNSAHAPVTLRRCGAGPMCFAKSPWPSMPVRPGKWRMWPGRRASCCRSASFAALATMRTLYDA